MICISGIQSHCRSIPSAYNAWNVQRQCHARKAVSDERNDGHIISSLCNRRDIIALVSTLVVLDGRSVAVAAETENRVTLPKDFVATAYDLIDALRESIDLDVSGAPEREVRRKAEPAKDLVKRFINNYSDAPVISLDPSCREIRFAVQELGEFYRVKGQRQRMDAETSASILRHLEEAEKSLPERPEKSIFPF